MIVIRSRKTATEALLVATPMIPKLGRVVSLIWDLEWLGSNKTHVWPIISIRVTSKNWSRVRSVACLPSPLSAETVVAAAYGINMSYTESVYQLVASSL
jgi:hypothetical protein